MSRLLKIMRVVLKLGVWNVLRVVRYRLGLRFRTLRFESQAPVAGDDLFFAQPEGAAKPRGVVQKVFGWKDVTFDAAPDWHGSVLHSGRRIDKELPWTQALAAVPGDVDVKEFWELSRFYWVPQLAREARNGDYSAKATLNHWLKDWDAQNPPFQGVNWSCGQEAAIRILHCAQAAILLDEVDRAQPALVRLLANSAARIAPTLHYALGQANNHGSAEAAGLFVAGAWLERLGADPRAKRWKNLGRRWLENRARTLILEDGSSNQYSTNYHRVVLDTFSFVEIWRRHLALPRFSDGLMKRLGLATRWLYAMTDATTGVAPVFGANDGSLLLAPVLQDHRDFRPSVQLAAALFNDAVAYRLGADDAILTQYGLPTPQRSLDEVRSHSFQHGGYHLLRRQKLAAVMRYPNFAFRPGHADALHVDLHKDGKPILFDAGTYSYVPGANADLGKTWAHNTVEFDGRNQMTSVSRFLYGDWLTARDVQPAMHRDDAEHCAAGYTDSEGASHTRHLALEDNALLVRDDLNGFKNAAIIRWRVVPSLYAINGNTVTLAAFTMSISPADSFSEIRVIEDSFAAFYNKSEKCMVVEVHVSRPGRIETAIRFH